MIAITKPNFNYLFLSTTFYCFVWSNNSWKSQFMCLSILIASIRAVYYVSSSKHTQWNLLVSFGGYKYSNSLTWSSKTLYLFNIIFLDISFYVLCSSDVYNIHDVCIGNQWILYNSCDPHYHVSVAFFLFNAYIAEFNNYEKFFFLLSYSSAYVNKFHDRLL